MEEALRVHQSATEDLPARVNELLRDVDITPSKEILRRYPHQLSGGQQQRIAGDRVRVPTQHDRTGRTDDGTGCDYSASRS